MQAIENLDEQNEGLARTRAQMDWERGGKLRSARARSQTSVKRYESNRFAANTNRKSLRARRGLCRGRRDALYRV
jgi:hypothetical protein